MTQPPGDEHRTHSLATTAPTALARHRTKPSATRRDKRHGPLPLSRSTSSRMLFHASLRRGRMRYREREALGARTRSCPDLAALAALCRTENLMGFQRRHGQSRASPPGTPCRLSGARGAGLHTASPPPPRDRSRDRDRLSLRSATGMQAACNLATGACHDNHTYR